MLVFQHALHGPSMPEPEPEPEPEPVPAAVLAAVISLLRVLKLLVTSGAGQGLVEPGRHETHQEEEERSLKGAEGL